MPTAATVAEAGVAVTAAATADATAATPAGEGTRVPRASKESPACVGLFLFFGGTGGWRHRRLKRLCAGPASHVGAAPRIIAGAQRLAFDLEALYLLYCHASNREQHVRSLPGRFGRAAMRKSKSGAMKESRKKESV